MPGRIGWFLMWCGSLTIGCLASTLFAQSTEPGPENSSIGKPISAIAPFDAEQAGVHQAAWGKHLGVAVESANSLDIKMVLIPPGEFQMGSSDEQVESALRLAAELKVDENTRKRIREGERPQHRMRIADPFFLADTEVTIAQFRKFVEETGYRTQAEELQTGNSADPNKASADERNGFDWRSPGFAQHADAAVSQVTWNDAVAFCNWLSKKESLPVSFRDDAEAGWVLLPQAKGYRLPTEAEWEYAARAGTNTHFHAGDDPAILADYGWFGFESGSTPVRVVGSKLPNAFGLHDMHGNVGEWCQDFYDLTSYPKHYVTSRPELDPRSRRVIRGGDWWGNALRCRSAFRGYGDQITRSDDLGFRLARTP
ncbi:MAG: formylglycine-generating enzyme family protein [Pirellulales bacterium]